MLITAASIPDSLKAAVDRVAELSPFFLSMAEADPALLVDSLTDSEVSLTESALFERYDRFLAKYAELDCSAGLRLLRRREMMRIIFRDLSRRASLTDTTAELSALADFAVSRALDVCYQQNVAKYGQPCHSDGSPQAMTVLAMGKLGARELNLSSDIDLIFLYSSPGTLQRDDGREMSHQAFFLRTARDLIACLDDAGMAERVFRVDMRLRPYGDSGDLVMPRAAMEKYYLEQGRDWERYAFIKARAIAGDLEAGEDFLAWMKHFVFRRHLDFAALLSLRDMKSLMIRQLELKGNEEDLKLGAGGIREIEFIAQALQLIWGGRHAELQEPRLLETLGQLQQHDFLDEEDASNLENAYTFLRNSEHAVQAQYDRQTHQLPDDPQDQERLARAMAFNTYDDYRQQLALHRQAVSRCFAELVTQTSREQLSEVPAEYVKAWLTPHDPQLTAFRQVVDELALSPDVLETLDALLPFALQCLGSVSQPEITQARVLAVVRSVLRRSTYLHFLCENPDALRRLVMLVDESEWIANQAERYPIVLYELTDRIVERGVMTRRDVEAELRELLRGIEPGDLELQMDALRQFRLAITTRVAAMELQGQCSVMQASDSLTALAEAIVETSCQLARRHLEDKHGAPADPSGRRLKQGLAVIAYGKAGGLELAYGSDLDLVFLTPDNGDGTTDGSKPLHNNVYFSRLAQRLVHILTSFTRFGVLYEVDLRLRPQGRDGPLVASLAAFDRYQREQAWTWEHQALIRSRFFAGDAALGEAFEKTRRDILQIQRDAGELREAVLGMREKMREQLPVAAESRDLSVDALGPFDLKRDAGAIVDIEFMVQYAVLASASRYPAISRWTDVMRLGDELASVGVMDDHTVDALQRAYLTFRAAVHYEWLGLAVDYERLRAYREEIQQIWEDRMGH